MIDKYLSNNHGFYNQTVCFIEVIKEHQAEVYLKLQSNGRKTTNCTSSHKKLGP